MTNTTATERISECIVEQTVNVLVPQISDRLLKKYNCSRGSNPGLGLSNRLFMCQL